MKSFHRMSLGAQSLNVLADGLTGFVTNLRCLGWMHLNGNVRGGGGGRAAACKYDWK